MQIKGIDVSRWQGPNIDWTAVKNADVKFAILKAGGSDDGFYKDLYFETNYKNAKAAGMPIGAYYFVGPSCISKEAGIADAKRFLEILKGKQFEYPCYIDLESTDPKHKKGATEAVIAFCKTMEEAGYYTGVYASDDSGFRSRLELDELEGIDKWVAIYRCRPIFVQEYGMWQYSSTLRINGIPSNVDGNIAFKDYPTIIKDAGLNGFPKKETTPEKPVETPEVKPEAKPNNKLEEGDKVRVLVPINFDNGKPFGRYYDIYEVMIVDGKRIVIGIDGVITAAVDASNLRKISSAEPANKPKLEVDGYWGKATTTRLQEIFGTPIDGIVSNQYKMYQSANPGLANGWEWKGNPVGGSVLIKAIQKKVGVTADGFIGPNTIKGIQKWLGTPQDGCFSAPSQCIKALQTWCNKQ